MSSAQPVKAMTVDPRRNTCSVLQAPASAQLSLDLCFDWPPQPSNKSRPPSGSAYVSKLLVRDANEDAAKTLERIRMLCPATTGASKKTGKRVTREEILASCPPVRALCQAPGASAEAPLVELDATSTSNADFFAALRELHIGAQQVTVVYNPPAITAVQSLRKPFVGLPLFCQEPSTLNCGPDDHVAYEWCVVGDEPVDEESRQDSPISRGSKAPADTLRPLSTARLFYPTEDLVGKYLVLRVSVNPTVGPWLNLRTPSPVATLAPPMERWTETPTYIPAVSSFRVTSYNILYDGFCDTKACRERIYPFASDEILSIENRQVRILQELIAHHSDIICLQECGKQLFRDYLLPSMQALGYSGLYVNKSGSVQEGCGLLFRTERFELLTETSFPLNWETLSTRYPALAARVAEHEEFRVALSHVTTIGSLSLLREKSTGKEVVVGNTHLFYHANGCHIRLLQTFMMLDALSRFAGQQPLSDDAVLAGSSNSAPHDTAPCLSASGEMPPVPALPRGIVLCGDLNCTHPTGAYRLLTTGQVESTHRSWEKGTLFWWGCDRQLGYSEEEFETLTGKKDTEGKRSRKETTTTTSAAEGGDSGRAALEETAAAKAAAERAPLTDYFHEDLNVPLRLWDAYDKTDPSLPWTNYTMTFREVIDYILFSQNIDVIRTIPIPPETELSQNFALPNLKYPSDHVSLIADLVFRD